MLDLEVLIELIVYLVSSPSLRAYVLIRYHYFANALLVGSELDSLEIHVVLLALV